jgi:gliding motility-associated-like protein
MQFWQIYQFIKYFIFYFWLIQLSLIGYGQQKICQNSTHQYSVDTERNDNDFYKYNWSVIDQNFKGSIVQNQNKATVDWNNTALGKYTLQVEKFSVCGVVKELLNVEVINSVDLNLNSYYYLCPTSNFILIKAPEGFDNYQWTDSDGKIIGIDYEVKITKEGKYKLEASTGSCSSNQIIDVELVKFPTFLVKVDFENSILVIASGGNTDVEYQLESLNGFVVKEWQLSNTFFNVPEGEYLIKIKSKNGECLMILNVETMLIPNVITPNNDGLNDEWNLSKLLKNYPNAKVEVYDRFGKILKTITKEDHFKWDGKILGRPLASDSYWFIIKFDGNNSKSGSLLIKNK